MSRGKKDDACTDDFGEAGDGEFGIGVEDEGCGWLVGGSVVAGDAEGEEVVEKVSFAGARGEGG